MASLWMVNGYDSENEWTSDNEISDILFREGVKMAVEPQFVNRNDPDLGVSKWFSGTPK